MDFLNRKRVMDLEKENELLNKRIEELNRYIAEKEKSLSFYRQKEEEQARKRQEELKKKALIRYERERQEWVQEKEHDRSRGR